VYASKQVCVRLTYHVNLCWLHVFTEITTPRASLKGATCLHTTAAAAARQQQKQQQLVQLQQQKQQQLVQLQQQQQQQRWL
jgi:hypothetical protein